MAARNLVQRSSSSLRVHLRNNKLHFVSSNPSFHDFSVKTLTTTTTTTTTIPPPPLVPSQLKSFSSSATLNPHFSGLSRSLCSSSKSSSNFVVIESEQEFSSSLNKVQDDSLPAIFYFTAAWCGPCKLMSPIIQELSKKYPHVTTYKIDVDQKELQSKLSGLNISSVPTLHFFQNGKKVSEMVGADVARLKQTVESLYKN